MGITCKLVRLGPDEASAIRAEPIDVLDLIDWDHPTDRWLDLDEPAWRGLLAAFEVHDRGPGETAQHCSGPRTLLASPCRAFLPLPRLSSAVQPATHGSTGQQFSVAF